MASRQSVQLDDADLIAAAQILGWLAFPARPEHGVKTIQQWAIRRQQARGEFQGEPPFPMDKPNRLQQRIDTLNHQLRRRLRAGDWLAQRMGKKANLRIIPGRGLRALARRESNLHEVPNLVRDYWTNSVPVIHLAKASLFAIIAAYQREGRAGWHLERTIFWPDWVPEAIEQSEQTARWTVKLKLAEPERLIRFHRE